MKKAVLSKLHREISCKIRCNRHRHCEIDTTIAQNILDRYEDNGYVYIPANIVTDRMVHCLCDNIDILEATIDGKNTFHCTQMMVRRRGPTPQPSCENV